MRKVEAVEERGAVGSDLRGRVSNRRGWVWLALQLNNLVPKISIPSSIQMPALETTIDIDGLPEDHARPPDCDQQLAESRAIPPPAGVARLRVPETEIEMNQLRPSPSLEVSNANVPADDRYLAYHHLSSEEALRRLLATADEILAEHRKTALEKLSIWTSIFRTISIVTLVLALALIAYYVHAVIVSSPYQHRATGALVEGCLLIAIVLWNIWLHRREARLTATEMVMRIQSIVDEVRQNGINHKQDLRIPTAIPTVSVTRVIRDRAIYTIPFNLLVEDDVIQLAYGDIAPCRIQYVYSHFDIAPGQAAPQYFLEKGEIFKPSLFGTPTDPVVFRRATLNEGQFHFRVTETPLRDMLKAALNFKRPETVLAQQLNVLKVMFSRRGLWIVLAMALVINALRYGIPAASNPQRRDQATEMLLALPVYAVLPLLPLMLPTLILVARTYGNAHILSTFDALQISKTQFEDTESVDEFDAAPPPMKDLGVDWGAVWKRFVDQLVKVDITFLARTTGLVDSLANTTVICAIDREGTISAPIPSVEQLFLLNESEDPILLDVATDLSEPGVRFEDRDWMQYMAHLKPLGLNILLNTDCGARTGRRRPELHRKSNQMHLHGRVKASRQTCMCQLGREIGFTTDALTTFNMRKAVQTFAPCHASVGQLTDYHFEIPSLFSQIFEETSSGTTQLFSEGSMEVVLECCGDYWNGGGLGDITENIEKRIYDFYQNAIIMDFQVVAYSYRPIQNAAALPFLFNTNPSAPVYLELLEPFDASGPTSAQPSPTTSVTDIGELSYSSRPLARLRMRPTRRKVLSRIDAPHAMRGVEEKAVYQEVVKGQTFLGMASFSFQPKAVGYRVEGQQSVCSVARYFDINMVQNIIDFIEDMGLAGIRFVYFSSAPERESKAYAERLGLEQDWNSCILLSSSDGPGPGYLEEHDMKAKLPRGVENIRDHIQNVDDVPLHVSLFAECSPYSIREMVRIFQEHGEVVLCVGSSLNDMNVDSFAMADISVSVDPLSSIKSRGAPHNGPIAPLVVGAMFATVPCALSLHSDTSIYSLSQIIREARTIADNGRQGFFFHLCCQLSLTLIILLSYCLLLPPILSGYQIMWLIWILVPIVSFSFLFTPHSDDAMTVMVVKNNDHLRDRWRFFWYWAARFSVPIILCIAVFILSLSRFLTGTESTSVFGKFGETSWMHLTEAEQWALLYAQNCTAFAWLFYIIIISATFLTRVTPLKSNPPYQNKPWLITSLLAIILQLAFFAVSVSRPYTSPAASLKDLPWWLYVLAFVGGPVLIVPVQELVKVHDGREWARFQKRCKLEFNTKL
ncbi:hypothetical protein HK104_001843 [Borealophlyctis nickersoniae]|nr:hypothetical protein HK104_001843 [Borealophlyctis nickersoniae]